MLLICPSCRSGLEVPDGTTALVRCPACKTVFAPADSAEPGTTEDTEEEERPQTRRSTRDEDEDRPRSRRGSRRSRRDEEEDDDDEDDERPENRDFDPEPEDGARRRRSPSSRVDSGLTPEERAARRAAFDRAALGARFIWASFGLFMASMLFFSGYFFQSAFSEPSNAFIVAAGLFGLVNWTLAAIGVGLCLSGPPSSGHWRYGIAAAVATGVHLLLMSVLVLQGRDFAIERTPGEGLRLSMVPTQQNATMFYITALVYPEGQLLTRGRLMLPVLTGVAEMVRTVLILMLLSRLARSALDEELAHKCTRAAGFASAGPGALALLIFAFFAFMIETNAGGGKFAEVVFTVVRMGVYAIVTGVMLPAYMVAREVADACDEPFQSLIPKL